METKCVTFVGLYPTAVVYHSKVFSHYTATSQNQNVQYTMQMHWNTKQKQTSVQIHFNTVRNKCQKS
jgi:hypothetical protein